MSSAAAVIIIINQQIEALTAAKQRLASDLVNQAQIDAAFTAMSPVSSSVDDLQTAIGL
jgi:hypothetical protein